MSLNLQNKLKKYSHTAGIKNDHNYRVRIPFSKHEGNIFQTVQDVNKNITHWNETCARAIELFGLPGDQYTCRFTKEAIEFWFLEEKDALLFELCCG